MSSDKIFLRPNGKPLSIKAMNKDTRVNINSNRINTKAHENYNSYDITKKGPFIWAKPEDYIEFAKINKITTSSYKIVKYSDMSSSEEEKKPLQKTKKVVPVEEKKETFMSSMKKVVKDIFVDDSSEEEKKVATVVPTCKLGVAGTILYNPDNNDPSKLPQAALDALCTFHISGLKGWAVVTDVIDGDTLDIVIYVPLNELALGHTYKRYTKTGVRSFIHTNNVTAGFFAKFRCRLKDQDSMEKLVVEGKFARDITKLFYQSINGRVWYEFSSDSNIEDKDKYGRTLVTLYSDETKKINYNEFLFQFNTKDIVVVEKYGGGTKSQYSKSLASRDKAETARVKKILDAKLAKYKASLAK
jgi:hypothetical protein